MSSSTASSSSQQDATSFLREAQFARPAPSDAPAVEAVSASDLLLGSYDPAKLHPMAGLSDTLDYLTLDDEKLNDTAGAQTAMPSRGFGDDLCYGTGTMYLGGARFLSNILFCQTSNRGLVLADGASLLIFDEPGLIVFLLSHADAWWVRSCAWWCLGPPRRRDAPARGVECSSED